MKRIQLQLIDKKLDDVVDEMAAAVCKRLGLEERDAPAALAGKHAVVASAIHEILEKYAHAYDTCGLASVCQEAAEVDPWSAKGQDQD